MGFIGASLPMQAVYRVIESAAASKATVFITGESGTGKEVCAESIHKASPRRDRPFVALNCSAIPKDLIESELFGHVKGAFTGAVAERIGATQQAHGGTLFLDEIGEMDVNLQAKLLRFLQTGTVQRVGANKTDQVDARIVCATNRDPLAEVAAGRFREDLYYRLHVIPIHLPALRERAEDALLIASHFLDLYAREEGKRFGGFDPEAERLIRDYAWPGNVRQLQNVIRNAVVLHDGDSLGADMLRPALRTPIDHAAPPRPRAEPASKPLPQTTSTAEAAQRIRPLARVEQEAIEEAITLCGGNIPRAAALLEVSPSTLYRKRQAWAEASS
jgi:two-component system repressor protein LuxO